jgi:hypothetical protein
MGRGGLKARSTGLERSIAAENASGSLKMHVKELKMV